MSSASFVANGWIDALVAHGEGREALSFGARSQSYVELARAARTLERALQAAGLEAGDVLAVLAPPSLSGVALIHACLSMGIVLLPLNARQSELEQHRAIADSHARALVVAPGAPAGPSSSEIGGQVGLLVLRQSVDATPGFEVVRPLAADVAGEWARRRDRLRDEGAGLLLRTSGTSGVPKGAVLGFDNLIASAAGSAQLLGSDPRDRWLLCMPLFHIGGLSILIRAARVGASVVIHERFDPQAVSDALDSQGITRVSLVATMLDRLLQARGERGAPEKLELVLLGGGPASDDLMSRAESLGYPLAPTYGLTEAASQVATRPPQAASVDRSGGLEPLGGVSLRIVDEAGQPVGPGVEGEIEVRGPIVMRGYLDDPEATARMLRSGWLVTGDIGRLDLSGRLRVLDRRTDLILSGGENVYPATIESALVAHPMVEEAGVIGVSDPSFGARPAAAVVLSPGSAFDRGALEAFCSERLARYECPVEWRVVEALPRTATGKLMRRELRVLFGVGN